MVQESVISSEIIVIKTRKIKYSFRLECCFLDDEFKPMNVDIEQYE